jgi:hypothetical protein
MFSPEKPQERCWFFLLAAGMALGVFAIGYVLINGHHHEFNSSWEPPWGILISTYEFFVLGSVGLALWTGIGRVLKLPLLEFAGARAVQIGMPSLLVGLGTLAIEFSHPLHLAMNEALVGSGFYLLGGAATLFYTLFLLLLGAEIRAVERKGRISPLFFSLGAWGAALAALFQTGILLGRMEDLVYWRTFPWASLTLSALALGGAFLPIVVRFGLWLRGETHPADAPLFVKNSERVQAFLVFVLEIVLVLRLSSSYFSTPVGAMKISPFLLSGPLALNFWLFEVLAGILAPAALLRSGRSRTVKRITAAGCLVIFGQFFAEYDRLLASQLGAVRQLAVESHRGVLEYVPCLPKSLVVIGAFCFFLFLWTVVEKMGSAAETRFPGDGDLSLPAPLPGKQGRGGHQRAESTKHPAFFKES